MSQRNSVADSNFLQGKGSIKIYEPNQNNQEQVRGKVELEQEIKKEFQKHYQVIGKVLSIWLNQSDFQKNPANKEKKKCDKIKYGSAFAVNSHIVLTCLSNIMSISYQQSELPTYTFFVRDDDISYYKTKILYKNEVQNQPLVILYLEQPLELNQEFQFLQFGNLSDCNPGNKNNFYSVEQASNKFCSIMAIGYYRSRQKLISLKNHNVQEHIDYFNQYNGIFERKQFIGNVQSINQCEIYYFMNMLDGYEGCPLFAKNNKDELIVVGMHIQRKINNQNSFNKGIYFTPEIMQIIIESIKDIHEGQENNKQQIRYIQNSNEQIMQSQQQQQYQTQEQRSQRLSKQQIKKIINWLTEKRLIKEKKINEHNKNFQELLKQKTKLLLSPETNRIPDRSNEINIHKINEKIEQIVCQFDYKWQQVLNNINSQQKIPQPNLNQNPQTGNGTMFTGMRLNRNNLSLDQLRQILPIQKQDLS